MELGNFLNRNDQHTKTKLLTKCGCLAICYPYGAIVTAIKFALRTVVALYSFFIPWKVPLARLFIASYMVIVSLTNLETAKA